MGARPLGSPEHTTMADALEITCPHCRERHPLFAPLQPGRIDRCPKCGHPFEVAPGHEGSGHEDAALVQGLMALRDELDRLRRELQDAQSELEAARDSQARINELARSLSISRQECETLRAQLEERVQEQEERSGDAANLVPERAAPAAHSEALMKQIDQPSADQRQAAAALYAESDPQLKALTVQLHECQLANQRLRSLLKVFGMVRNLD
jgi:uncharacterized Zn finger protein (UPF0148 family)